MKSYKLALPSVEDAWRRDRSLQALSGALSHQPLVWMLGLPGAGKTTLAAQWVRQAQGAGRTCIWYRLDEDDEDIAALFDALRQTAGAADLPAWSPAHGTEPERFARQFFAQWLEAHPSGLTLVLDDCHRLGAGSGFLAWWTRWWTWRAAATGACRS
ncbi:AAA family ATPase [Roseateles sp.]|uniref:AAA family ATPase n=1 Tax=Roseateles sp. TaxID=1971397 RepID=UPI0039629073